MTESEFRKTLCKHYLKSSMLCSIKKYDKELNDFCISYCIPIGCVYFEKRTSNE